MAQITGSSTIDWSGVTLDPIDFEQKFNEFGSRFDQVLADFDAGNYVFNSPPTSTLLSFTLIPPSLNSGAIITARGSGFDTDHTVLESFDYNNPTTGDVVSFTGTFDFVGNEVINSFTVGVPGLQVAFIGNIVVDPLGNILGGSITQLQETLGSTEATLKGSLVVDANFDISGTVTQISVVDGTNTILMSGLSLPFSALDSVTTANDLFSVVGNQLAGDDVITYNSALGIELFGGAGNDTITGGTGPDTLRGGPGNDVLNGAGGNDTLRGSTGNDRLKGGAGADTLQGGAGDDLVLLASAAQFAVGEVIDGGTQDITGDTLRFTSTVAETLTLSANVIDVERVEIATAAGDPTGLATINVNAAAVTSNGMTLVGNNGANVLTGTAQADTLIGNGDDDTLDGGLGNDTLTGNGGNDTLTGGAGNDTLKGGPGADTLQGGAGDDLVLLASAAQFAVGEVIDGGTQDITGDTLRFTSTVAETLTLSANVIDVERVEIATAAGDPTGLATINVNAAAVTSNGMTLVGNNGANQITGTAFADTLTGNLGNDTLNGMAGNDTLKGGPGADTLQGGAGDDLVLLASAAQFAVGEVIDGGDDTDTLRYVGNAADTFTLTNLVTNIEQVEIATAAGDPTGIAAINVNAAAVANGLTILGNDGANVLTGTAQADTLIGNDGNDRLKGGLGDDTLDGGLGNDNYRVNRGGGQDIISENDSTPGNSDTLLYGATINPLDLVLSRQVNDLRLAVHGGTDQVTIQNWYSAPTTAQVETIQASNGQTLVSTQVDQLIQAMAGFTQQTGLSWDAASGGAGDPGQQAQFQGIIAANWQ